MRGLITALIMFVLTLQIAAPVYARVVILNTDGQDAHVYREYSKAEYGAQNEVTHRDEEPFNYSEPPPYDFDDPPRNYDWSPDMVSGLPISKREEGLDIKGEVPAISEDFGGSARDLNGRIDEAVLARIRAAKRVRAKTISFAYETYSDTEMISVIILSTVTSATSKTEYDSVNFDPYDGEEMDLTDAAGFDITPLAEKILNERIRRDPERYNASFDTSGIAENPFYFEDGTIVILFDDFQLTSSAADSINELPLELDRVEQIEDA